jgi:crotonobetainyl-CoA:carnitine CoA-transferase CaiB-like acyl-CoA transferase
MTATSNLPLQGVRVLDLSSVVLGPYASQTPEYGADVIKIEPPEGDSTRRTGPSTEPGMGAIFLGVNRGKRSVVLDLKRADARAALLALVDGADVLMHSIRPQKLAAIGLDPDTLLRRNPRLVYVGLHGFAEDGPYGGMPAYDDIIQGLSGCAGLMERQGGTPQYFPTIAADKTSGLVATSCHLAALFRREPPAGAAVGCRCSSYGVVQPGRTLLATTSSPARPRRLSPARNIAALRTADGYLCTSRTDALEAILRRRRHSRRATPFRTSPRRTKNIDALYTGGPGHQTRHGRMARNSARLECPPLANRLEDRSKTRI